MQNNNKASPLNSELMPLMPKCGLILNNKEKFFIKQNSLFGF